MAVFWVGAARTGKGYDHVTRCSEYVSRRTGAAADRQCLRCLSVTADWLFTVRVFLCRARPDISSLYSDLPQGITNRRPILVTCSRRSVYMSRLESCWEIWAAEAVTDLIASSEDWYVLSPPRLYVSFGSCVPPSCRGLADSRRYLRYLHSPAMASGRIESGLM